MDIERKCLQCWYCAEDTTPKQQPQLIGHRSYMCLAGPPSSSALPTANGALALIATYPQVTKDSISCARYVPPPPTEVRALIRKGTNNGNE